MGNDVSLADKLREKVEEYGKCFSCCSSSATFKRDDIDVQLLKQSRRSDQSKRMLLDKIHNINDVNDIPLETGTLKLIIGLKDVEQLSTGCSPNATVDLLPDFPDLPDFVTTLPSVKEEEEDSTVSIELDEMQMQTSVPELHDVVSDAISIMTDDNPSSRRTSIIEYNRSNKASSEMFEENEMDSNDTESEDEEDDDIVTMIENDTVRGKDEQENKDFSDPITIENEVNDNEVIPVNKHQRSRSHLMRRQSSSQWNEKEIEKLKDEMKDQLEFLKHSHTKSLSLTDLNAIHSNNHSMSPTMIIGNNESLKSQIFDDNAVDSTNDENESSENDNQQLGIGSTHNLLRPKSIDKWDSDEIEDETDNIRKELVRLTSQ